MVIAQKESLLRFGREQDLTRREENRPTGACPLYYLYFFLRFLSYLFLFFLLFSFTLFFFYSVNTLCFSIPFSRHGKGPFIVPAVASFLPLCPLTAFVWFGRTCQPPKVCDTHSCQTKAGLFHSLVHRSTLFCHDINAFSFFPSRHVPNGFPLNLASFG